MKLFKFIINFFSKKEPVVIKNKTINGKLFEVKNNKQGIIDYTESFLIDCGIDLSNVYIQNINNNGCCKLALRTHKNSPTSLFSDFKFSNVWKQDTQYLILPDFDNTNNISDVYYIASVWIHEIAHYIFKHNFNLKSKVITEYEACLYSEKMLEKMPIFVRDLNKIYKHDIKFHIDIRNIYLKYLNISNKDYVESYLEKESDFFKSFGLPKEIKKYLKEEPYND